MEEKKTDWKSLIGMTLIFGILMFMFMRNESQNAEAEAKKPKTEKAASTTTETAPATTASNTPKENTAPPAQTVAFTNDLLDFEVSTKGGYITKALVKEYKTYDGKPVYLAQEKDHSIDFIFTKKDGSQLHTKYMYFTPVLTENADNKVLTLTTSVGDGDFIEFRYSLPKNKYMMDFTVRSQGLSQVVNTAKNPVLQWDMKAYKRSQSMTNENRYTEVKFEYDGGRTDYTGQSQLSVEEDEEDVTYIAYKQHFFTSILLTEKPFKTATMKSYNMEARDETQDTYTKSFKSTAQLAYTGGDIAYDFDWYFGPTDFYILDGYEKNLDEVVDLGWGIFGWVNEYAIRPLFTFLTTTLGLGFGLAIILLTICVRLVLSPVLYKSYLTQAKMKILRPELDRIAEKYKDNAMKKQQETMKVQSEAGASPLSGCLPALLQMPVFFALFKFFPTAFDLRQKSFLWAEDLSSYDTIYKFPGDFSIPFYGDHISLFPILASIAIFFYMQMTTGQAMSNPQPGMPNMKFIMYLSPLFMLVFFNNYASGLSLYYFMSNLITIGIMLVIKYYIIDKDKVLAKIEKAKATPKKKGKFATKMAQIMEQAQAQQEAQKKGK
ncbi:MAG: membrane protein insertase YidC [Nonlabens sp.]|nr:membrane protein insertase YidC [Nonlabens sp.]